MKDYISNVVYFSILSILCYSSYMVRTRRVLFFSNKVLNYLIIFTLFFFSLFIMRLWWPVTRQYEEITSIIVIILSTITSLYGLYNIGIIIFLLLKDHVFLTSTFFKDLLKIALSVILIFITQLLMTVSTTGIILAI